MVNCSVICAMGLTFLDDNMQSIIDAMSSSGPVFSTLGMAKAIGACLALGVAAYESYMMMLGRRGMDVMKIVRVLVIAICISQSGWIARELRRPGAAFGNQARAMMTVKGENVIALEKELKDTQNVMMENMFEQIDSIRGAQRAEYLAEQTQSMIPDLEGLAGLFGNKAESWAKKGAIWLETYISNLINSIMRWIGELIFQLMYYGIILAGVVCLNIMAQFMPLAFALSLAPAYKSAWSQFISKYISVTLWAPLCYVMATYVYTIISYQLSNDIKAAEVVAGIDTSWGAIGNLGMDMLSTTVSYLAGLLIGAKMISMVTEIAGWLIPGGVSSGMGGAASGAITGAAATGGSIAGGAIGSGATIVSKAPTTIATYGAGFSQDGISGTLAQTSIGKSIMQARDNATKFNPPPKKE